MNRAGKNAPSPQLQKLWKEARETLEDTTEEIVDVYEGGFSRQLIVPRPEPTLRTVVLTQSEFVDLQRASTYIPPEVREALNQQTKNAKNAKEEAVAYRKALMRYYDDLRHKNRKLNDIEEDAKKLSDDLNRRVERVRIENEDEVKNLNRLIWEVKCQSIRDDQVEEKVQIEQETKGFTRALEEMMERERVLQLGKSEEEERIKKERDKIYGDKLRLQMFQNLEREQLRKEEKYDDAKLMRDLVRKIQLEDMAAFRKNRAMKRELLETILAELDDLFARRDWEKERKLTEELRVLAFSNEKAEREEAEERRKKEEARARAMEIDRLRKMQERARDVQAEKDEQRARRAQEDLERKMRKRELDEAFKLAQDKVNLRKALDEQVDLKDSLLAAEKKKSREEFHRVLYELVTALEKERKEALKKKQDDLQYGRDLRKQIRENEKQFMAERRAIFKEGEAFYEDEQRRKKNLNEMKKEKFEYLESLKVKSRYMAHINRKVDPTGRSQAKEVFKEQHI